MIKIGDAGWVKKLKELTGSLGKDFWEGFKPASEDELQAVERYLGRKLDGEFREFYRTIGYGEFPNCGGQFDSPATLIQDVAVPIYFVTGSSSPGEEWATSEQHTKLWLSRGQENPNPKKFTNKALTLGGVKLYDLLQFGSDGCGCYHQLYVGPAPAPLRYCLLMDSEEIENRANTFSEGLESIIASLSPSQDGE